jgi:hypothetical protein
MRLNFLNNHYQITRNKTTHCNSLIFQHPHELLGPRSFCGRRKNFPKRYIGAISTTAIENTNKIISSLLAYMIKKIKKFEINKK